MGYFYKDLESVIGTDLTYQAICNPIAVGDLTNNPCPNGNPGVLVDKITWSNLPGGSIQGVELALQHASPSRSVAVTPKNAECFRNGAAGRALAKMSDVFVSLDVSRNSQPLSLDSKMSCSMLMLTR